MPLLLCVIRTLMHEAEWGAHHPYENVRVYVIRVYIKNSNLSLYLSEPESSRWSGHFVVAEETWVRIPVPASKKNMFRPHNLTFFVPKAANNVLYMAGITCRALFCF